MANLSLTDIIANSDLESAAVNSIFAEMENWLNGVTANADISITGAMSALSYVASGGGATIDEFSTDGTLAGNSDTAVPTEKAVKTYVDTAVLAEDFWDRSTTTVSLKNAGDTLQLNTTEKLQFRDTGLYINSSIDGQLDIVSDTLIALAGAATFDTSLNDVTTTEFAQLETIGATTISAAQWGYLGELDQSLTQASSPTFAGITGELQTAAQPKITSLGTLTTLTVDDITINGNAISSAGASSLTITPTAGQALVLDSIWSIDSNTIQGLTAVDLNILATAGQKVNIESVGFDGTVVTGASSITSTAFVGTLSTAAQPNITSLGTLTTLTVDDITINGNAISSAGASSLTITPTAGQALVLDAIWSLDENTIQGLTAVDLNILATAGQKVYIESVAFDGTVITAATSITSTAFIGDVTGNVSGTAATVTGAAQAAITSLGTLTTLTVDNITLNGSAITHATAADLTITGTAGNAVVVESVSFDGGVVTGLVSLTDGTASWASSSLTGFTGITATNLTGTLQTAAQGNITSLGTLTTLTVDNITINGSTISHATAANLVITATAGNAVAIEGVTFDGGAVSGTTLTTTGNIGIGTTDLTRAITVGNNKWIAFRDAADSNTRRVLGVDGSDIVVIGDVDGLAAGIRFDTADGAGKLTISNAGAATFAGRALIDDTTEATTTLDGSLQTDGGLSVAKAGVFGGAVKVGAYTLPATDGTTGQVLVTNGSGVLTWTTL